MKIYTKTGDRGFTSLLSGKRVKKYHIRVETYGSVDELNSFLGLLGSYLENDDTKHIIRHIQNDLFDISGRIAADSIEAKNKIKEISEQQIQYIENQIDLYQKELPRLRNFILPAGNTAVSTCHVCRSICRRCERLCVRLADECKDTDDNIIIYLNRLSDFLFVLARKLSLDFGISEVEWQH